MLRTCSLSVRFLLINQLGVNLGFYLLVPYLATHLAGGLGLSLATVGVVLGVRNLSQQGLFLVGGSAADRLGPRRVIIAGCGLRTIGFGLFAFGESVPLLLAAAVLSGLSGALFNPAVRAYIAVETPPARRAEIFALFNVFAQAGALLGPVLGALLLLVDFRVAAVAAAVVFAGLTVAQALLLPSRAVPAHTGSVLADWRECVTNRRFLAFTLALSGMFALQNQLYLVLPVEAERVTGTSASVAAIFVVSTIATLVLQVPITRRFGALTSRGRALALGMTIMGGGFAVLPLGHPLAVLSTTLLLAIGVMIVQPFVNEMISSFGADRVTGTYFGLFYLVSGLVAAVTTAGIGWLSEHGRWPAALACVAIGLVCAAAITVVDRRGALRPDELPDRPR